LNQLQREISKTNPCYPSNLLNIRPLVFEVIGWGVGRKQWDIGRSFIEAQVF